MQELEEWKNSKSRKPLLLLGARQTGKTWLMKELGKRFFSSVVYLELDHWDEFQDIFSNVTDTERILRLISAYTSEEIIPGETLIILDEIQETPGALTALKYLCEKAPEYHIAAAGSYLGISLNQEQSFPVGKVDILHVKPMSFSEFLLALGRKSFAEMIKKHQFGETQVFQQIFEDLLRLYYFVGGMPEAVKTFADTNDFQKVRTVQNRLLTAYQADFGKHIPAAEAERIRLVWNSIPNQLAKEKKRFTYKEVSGTSGTRAKTFEMAIQWLQDAGLVYKINRVERPYFPLSAYRDDRAFKLYFLDIGLLGAKAGLEPSVILNGSIFFVEFKGAMSEQFVLQELKLQLDPVYYWTSPSNSGEIDFIISAEEKVWPIEVNSGTNVRSKSLKAFVEKYHLDHGIRLSLLPFQIQDWLTNYPIYFSGQLLDLIAPERNEIPERFKNIMNLKPPNSDKTGK